MLDGYKTYIAAAGFIGLAIYQISNGEMDKAFGSIMLALTALGLRSAITKIEPPAPLPMAEPMDDMFDSIDPVA